MLKKSPFTRTYIIKFTEAIAYLLGLIIVPFMYPFKRSISNNPKVWKWLLFYWFSNSDEDLFVDNWYGVYEIGDGDYEGFKKKNFIAKFIMFYRWVAIRNPHWELKLAMGVGTIGKEENVKIKKYEITRPIGHEDQPTIWMNYTFHGVQNIRFNKGKYKHFRKSSTRPLKKWSPFKWLGFTHINKMLGCGNTRYISKLRVFKYTEEEGAVKIQWLVNRLLRKKRVKVDFNK